MFKITCQEFSDLCSKNLNSKLGLLDRIKFRIHKGECEVCAAFASHLSEIDEMCLASEKAAQADTTSGMPDEVRKRLLSD